MISITTILKNWLIRTFIVLINFLFFTTPSISVSANSIGYEQAYRSYTSIDIKIAEKINSSTSKNLKDAISVVWFTCKSEIDLVDYGSRGIGVEVVAGKASTQFTKSSLSLGREMHKGYKLAEHAPELGRFKEFTGIKGIRPDFVDFGTKTIYELKPFNPRGIQMGTQQLNKYKSLFEQNYGGTWKTVLDHY